MNLSIILLFPTWRERLKARSILLLFREVPGPNLQPKIEYLDWVFFVNFFSSQCIVSLLRGNRLLPELLRIIFFFCDSTAQIGPRPPHVRSFWPHKITYTHTHTHTVGRLWTSDQLFAKAATYITHNKHKRRTSVPSEGFQPTNRVIGLLQTYALDGAAAGIGPPNNNPLVIFHSTLQLTVWIKQIINE